MIKLAFLVVLLLAVLVLVSMPAKADPTLQRLNNELCWTNPAKNVDGSDYTDRKSIKIYCSLNPEPADANTTPTVVSDANIVNATQRVCYSITVVPSIVDGFNYCRITAVDTSDNESDWSNTVNFISASGQAYSQNGPASPVGFSVQ